jgi:hypothetical protein
MKTRSFFIALSGAVILFTTPGRALTSDTPTESADAGKFWVDARLRIENVNQDNALQDATAITLRTHLGYETGKYRGFQLLLEAENISAIQDDYNSTTNGKTQYSVIADPEDTEVNRLYLS